MSVMTPYRSELRVRRDGFAQLLRAEWTKFRTVRGWVIGMAVAMLVIVGLGALTGANSECGSQMGPDAPALGCPAPPTGPGGGWVADSFYFVRQPLAGNGSITVRVTSLTGLYSTHGATAADGGSPTAGMTPGVQPWSKAGIIIKASTRQGAAYAAMMVTGSHGVRMQWDFTHDVAGLAGKVSAASPRWLRLTRSGDTITGYDSADGAHWTRVGIGHAGRAAVHHAGRAVRRLARVLGEHDVTRRRILHGRTRPGHRYLRPGEPAGRLARGPVDRPGHPGDHGHGAAGLGPGVHAGRRPAHRVRVRGHRPGHRQHRQRQADARGDVRRA